MIQMNHNFLEARGTSSYFVLLSVIVGNKCATNHPFSPTLARQAEQL